MGLFRKAVTTLGQALRLTDPQLYRHIGLEPAHSGEKVTPETALTLDAFWACVWLIAQTIATLPLMLYEAGDEDGEARLAKDHPLYRVIHDRPNADMTAVEFWTAIIACKLVWGNGYAAIQKRGDGSVIALEPLLPSLMQVQRQQDGSRTYTYTFDGLTTVYQEEDILHLKGFSLDGLTGLSVVSAGRHSLGAALGAERVAGTTFKNGMRPSGVFMAPSYLDKTQRQDAKAYLTEFQGAQNTGKVPVLEGGWKWEALTLTPADAELLKTRGFNVETVARLFRVPPILIGHAAEGHTMFGSGVEQVNLGFLIYCLRTHMKEIEQALGMRCLRPGERDRFYAEFNVEGLLRADSKGRAEFLRGMVNGAIYTPNDARRYENLPPVEGGDHLMIQGAMMPLDVLVEQAALAAAQMMAEAQAAAEGAADGADDPDEATDDEIDAVTDDDLKGLFSADLLRG
ncbi:HK97 family phage portal protein [Methylorubrum rhodinum]|uniref:HK97 family phage portal protein n=1 Tax=Methylorubrum rhodinum TaxID=29428 RepID=A0A840ZQ58_9HYPH|nr:phage portal protein [Methylorubrum rhodinum]MBB5758843.1 HK97 family phage portal protein [Methylorubrum rhodinum]